MSHTPYILHALELNGKGSGTLLEGDAISQSLKEDTLAWLHMDAAHPESRKWLEENVSYLDPLILDALVASETRPRMEEYDDGMLVNLRGINLNENADPDDMVSLRMWIDPHRIITMRRRSVSAAQVVKGQLLEGNGPKNAGDFLCAIIHALLGKMDPFMHSLAEKVDDVEEEVIANPNASIRSIIVELRSQAITMKRYISPQRDVIGRLRVNEQSWIERDDKRSLQESLDKITRYVEELDSARERAQIVQDELTNVLADKLNRNMYILSVIAAIFLPLGFLTGLLGINVGGMPGAENADAFWIVTAGLTVIVALQVAIFRWLRWF